MRAAGRLSQGACWDCMKSAIAMLLDMYVTVKRACGIRGQHLSEALVGVLRLVQNDVKLAMLTDKVYQDPKLRLHLRPACLCGGLGCVGSGHACLREPQRCRHRRARGEARSRWWRDLAWR